MKPLNNSFRPDLQGRAKKEFNHPREKKLEFGTTEKQKAELDKWKKPTPELKPDDSTREVIDRRMFAMSFHADAENALKQAELAAAQVEAQQEPASISDMGGPEMAQALLESYNHAASVENEHNFGR